MYDIQSWIQPFSKRLNRAEWKGIVITSTIWAVIIAGFCSMCLVTFADAPGQDGKGCSGGHSDESLILKHGIYRAQMNG